MTLEEILQRYESGVLSTTDVLIALEANVERPLSEGQRGLWTLQRMEPDMYAYNVPVCFSCPRVDVAVLEAAFHRTLARHPILTATVRESEGNPCLSHGDPRTFRVERVDVSDVNEDGLLEYLRNRARAPFDLARGPLVRLSVLSRNDGPVHILLVVHHIVIDGTSLGTVLDTLFRTYRDLVTGQVPVIDVESASFSEFVEWERETLDGPKCQAAREFWKKELAGIVPLKGLPFEKALPIDAPHQGEVHRSRLSPAQISAVDAFIRENDISHGIFFLAVFKTLLLRYTEQEDIVVGMAAAARPQARFDSVVGYFVNAIPIRSTLSPENDFSSYARRVQKTVLTAIEYGYYPFARMVRDLGARDLDARSPIFQVGYNYQNFSLEKRVSALREDIRDALSLEMVSGLHQSGEYDLALEVIPNEGFVFHWKYNPAAFSGDTVERMSEHFDQLIDAIVASAGKEVPGRLNMLGPEEYRRLTVDWNQTEEDYPVERSCVELFAEHTASSPERPAVTFGEETVTYRELDERSAGLALALRQHGVSAGECVGICVERSIDMVTAVLAILKCGAAYLPLDPESPPSRLSFMIQDSGCKWVVAQRTTKDRLSAFESRVSIHLMDSPADLRVDLREDAAPPIHAKEAAAYVIYTSGSTGRPKGVAIPHRALTNILVHTMRKLGVSAHDRLLAIAAFSFDMAATELLLPLAAGAHVHIADSSTVRDPALLSRAIEQVRPTFMWATPSTWNRLFRTGWRNDEKVTMVSGGEALSDGLKDQMLATGAVAWNLYGPTEATQYSAGKRLRHDESVTIGKPVSNTQIYILDTHLQPVPVGVEGELCISGYGIALGYPKNPELTSQRFVENPFRPGRGMYKTGDRARRLPNGEIKLLGRRDEQIKFRGFRIEPAEIELAIESFPGITASAIVLQGAGDEQRLAAYFTSRQPIDAKLLRAHLKQALPAYMVPAELLPLASLPLTSNGKVDKNALREKGGPARTAPRPRWHTGSIERRVRAIFGQALGGEDFDRHEGFFDLGGDSFTAVVTIERINEAFGCQLPVTDLFAHPSLDAMCRHLASKWSATTTVRNDAPARKSPPSAYPSFDAREDAPLLDGAIAVIGLSCQFPSAKDHGEYWENLRQGKDSVRSWSPEELRAMGVPEALVGRSNFVPQRSEIDGKAEFDPAFFGISPRDAEFMDPQGRLLLLHAWKALEDAGHRPEDAPNTSVFMSTSTNFYQMLLPSLVKSVTGPRVLESAEHYVAWTFAQGGSIPTMISTKLGLTGPSMHVSTNCSSALSGLYLACQSLLAGEADRALVGAATIFSAMTLGYVHQPGLNLSSDGRCKTFDEDADGMAGGEGVGVVLLKRAREALADGDNVYCVIRGIAVNNDGGDKAGFHAPSAKGQARVIRKVLEKTGVDPETIAYVEAHGTGTKIGDPIEIAALTEAFRDRTNRTRFCGIGSVKSNIGHVDSAAGMAGLIKMALSLRHGEIPRTLHHRKDNAAIDWDASPFFVADENLALDPKSAEPHRVGLSSFGIGGSNAHALLEQARWAAPMEPLDSGSHLVVLSARDADRLRMVARRLLEHMPEYRRSSDDLTALAYTLQVGRRAMASRVAFLAHDCNDLEQKVTAYVAGELPDGAFTGTVGQSGSELAALFGDDHELAALKTAWLERHEWKKVASLWIHGVELDWRAAYGSETPRRVSLPTYPFDTKRYWLGGTTSSSELVPLGTTLRDEAQALLEVTAGGDIDGFLARQEQATRDMDAHLRGVLFAQLSALGMFEAREPCAGLRVRHGIAEVFAKWLDHCVDVLVDGGYLVRNGDYLTKGPAALHANQAWRAWREWARTYRTDPEMGPRVLLAERMLEAIPEIVTGMTPATQIMFPGSSLELVETIYKKNAVFDYFHATTATAVQKAVESLRQRGPRPRIRILEIGAGTGSSSEHVFERLKPYEADIAEYCYTDLGKAFLIAAEKRFGARLPYLTFQRFDAEKAPSAQGIATGCYDIVLANNVLHATTNIVETVEHARALLSPGGVIVLNELAQNGLFAHLTFGLLEGWWRFTDGERLAGGPALSPASWSKVLRDAGFQHAEFPAERAHALGWQIIVGRADGSLREAPQREHRAPAKSRSVLETGDGVDGVVRRTVVEALIAALKLGRDELQNDGPFADYGLDSLTGVNLVEELNRALGIDLDTTVLFDHPTVDRLTAFILAEHRPSISTGTAQESAPAIAVEPVQERPRSKEPIAIIGMSGRFPGADDAEAFWQHLEAGTDLVTEAERWDLTALGSRCVHGGFMKDIASFDPLFFNISGLEAEYMEPQQRLFLEETWKALEDAGYAGEAIKGPRCGVYAGCTTGDYFDVGSRTDYPAQALWGNMGSLVPSRIAYYLDLHGPALTVDTACSSSLVAIHLACQALWNGDIDMAIAGGVFVQCTPKGYVSGSRAGMLSPSGRCRSFDDAADGFVPAEGVGSLILKRLGEAEADGDNVHGVVRGIGINQDGTSNGITAPNAGAQEQLIREIYEEFAIDCEGIQMIEAHGTGTKLGDPVEFKALTRAFRHFTDKRGFCSLGSSKANIGHAQTAAGVLGIIKILLAMKHAKMPPLLHHQATNKSILLEGSPFFVHTDVRDWPADGGGKRRAAITSLGASGTNAHAVIEEAPARRRAPRAPRPYLIALSARTSAALRDQRVRLAEYCRRNPDAELADVSYTLLLGRAHFEHRWAAIVMDLRELGERLTGEAMGDTSNAPSELQAYAARYLEGQTPRFADLFSGENHHRVSLPTYPFERTSYWLPEGHVAVKASPLPSEPATMTLTGNEFFLRDHRVQGSAILPGAMYLELACTAWGGGTREGAVSLEDVVFMRPLGVSMNEVEVRTELRSTSGATRFEVLSREAGRADTPHCQGTIAAAEKVDSIRLDIPEMRKAFRPAAPSIDRFYEDYRALGIDYGPSFHGCAELYTTKGAVLARLRLPDAATSTLRTFTVHPVLVDSAMQCVRLLTSVDGEPIPGKMLFAFKKVTIVRPCASTMWAWIRHGAGESIDIDIADEQGVVCVMIRGAVGRPVAAEAKPSASPAVTLLPVWEASPEPIVASWPEPSQSIAILGGTRAARDALAQMLPNARVLPLGDDDSVDAVERTLRAMPVLDHLIWLAPEAAEAPTAEALLGGQSRGVLQVFRILKALLGAGHGARTLGWTVLTHRAHALRDGERTDPTHAGIAGLAGSLAKEYPNWQLRIADLGDYDDASLRAVLTLGPEPNGNTRLHRNNQWYAQRFATVTSPATSKAAVRKGAVIVITGGAGGLGVAISEHMMRRYGARIVWLGRREKDARIEASSRALAALGAAPCYVQADASDAASLRRAHQEITRRFGAVNGLIHASLSLSSGSLAKSSEAQLHEVLRAKMDAAVRATEEFQGPSLDFALFLSSINSYLKAMAQGSYAAASTFVDAFAAFAGRRYGCSSKVINLGYCFNNVGAKGIALIERDELMAGLETLLASDMNQTTLMKFSPALNTRGMDLAPASSHAETGASQTAMSRLPQVKERMKEFAALAI
ncbi:amino acid adenylation domain-containing protein [Pendulispora brunnea]|uniref:Amino acid adenylation domain-containing protein n=1 Tax=Pendulispora brunnea TaxID=2905690 RepID=A0ABZ2KHX2_9BACT